jgi:hypothetical protein
VERLGLDRAPIDARDAVAADWLRASLWPGQTSRHARLDAALARASVHLDDGTLRLDRCDASVWPDRLTSLAKAHRGAFVLAYQTLVADYLTPDVRAAYEAGMRAWLLADPTSRLWARLEQAPRGDGGERTAEPADLTVCFAKGDAIVELVLGSGEFHPEALRVNGGAAEEVRRAFALARIA